MFCCYTYFMRMMRKSCECQDEFGDILRITEVNFVSLSCIGQPLWDLCECQIIIEATLCTVGVNIKFPYRFLKNVVLRRPNVLKTLTVYRFYGVYTVTIFTRHFSSNSAQIHQ